MLKERVVDFDAATGRMRSTPRQIFLELTPRCNLTCVHCARDYGRVVESPDVDMKLETIERLRPWIDRCLSLNLNMVGEPLIAKHFREVLELASAGSAATIFNTNGIGLTDEMCDFIVRCGVAHVIVSFDGIESSHPIRGVGYELLRDRLLALAAAKERAGSAHPSLAVAYTIMRRNLHELPRMLEDLMPRNCVEHVHVQPLIVFYETLRDQNVYHQSEVDEVVARSRAIAKRHGGTFTLFRSTLEEDERFHERGVELQIGQHSERFGCIDPFYEVKVCADGTLQPCSNGFEFGPRLNVHELELEQIWNHSWYRGLRRRLYRKDYEDRCRACPFVFGSAANQTSDLRPGVHHSRESRFRAGAVGKIPKTAPPRRLHPFLDETGSSASSRSLYE